MKKGENLMLKVNEIFGPTIQGEGKSIGESSIFLRVAFCNLHCIWCDTPYAWNWEGTSFEHSKKFKMEDEVHSMSKEEVIDVIQELNQNKESKVLVITGGEPLLQQKDLIPVLKELKEDYWIEVETNGTILPLKEFNELIDQYNCSPKMSNSGNEKVIRRKDEVLSSLSKNPKITFKFVVSNNEDIPEILEYINTFNIDKNSVYLMPLGMTREELQKTTDTTKKLCEEQGFNFSDRLHITKFGGKRGV